MEAENPGTEARSTETEADDPWMPLYELGGPDAVLDVALSLPVPCPEFDSVDR